MGHKILLVEDDESISEMVKGHLMKEGFQVSEAFDGEEGVQLFLEDSFDLVLLDLMLPKLDGMEVIKMIRDTNHVPILIMSAKDGDVDKAIALGFGADDYISKPFSMIELTARIKASIRRATKYAPNTGQGDKQKLKIGTLEVDLNSFSVVKDGESIKLTSKEFDILKIFITNPERVFTKAQIYNLIWHDAYYGDENVINVHMRRLREKIEDNPSDPIYIKTLWGIGYKLGDF